MSRDGDSSDNSFATHVAPTRYPAPRMPEVFGGPGPAPCHASSKANSAALIG